MKNTVPSSPLSGNHVALAAGTASDVEFLPDKAMLGLLIFLGTEAMFFAGLISSFLILRAAGGVWPPVGQPRLPVVVTAVNSIFLLASALTMQQALKAARQNQQAGVLKWLGATGGLGVLFLGVQGVEWVRLVNYGLTLTSSNYGATFYTLIGFHGLHVLAAVIVLAVVFIRATRRRYTAENHHGLALCRVYWFFVVALWPLLYVLVYLS